MAKIYSFDGSNIRCTNSETGEWSAIASNWRDVKAMTILNGELIIAADTSIYGMNTSNGTTRTIAQNWRGIVSLHTDGTNLLVLAEGGWYRMDPTNASAKGLGEHSLYYASVVE